MEENKMVSVWYIDGNELKFGNKIISRLDYDGVEIAVMKSKQYGFGQLLLKDIRNNNVYWELGVAPIRFQEFIKAMTINLEDSKKYCDDIKNKFKNLNLKDFFDNKIQKNLYFNKCELEYISQYYPDIIEMAKESRENCIRKQEENIQKRKIEHENYKREQVAEKNKIFKSKINEIKNKIYLESVVNSENLEFYKNGNYENGLTIQNCFLYLAREYGINIPLATQGFINNKLVKYDFKTHNYYFKLTNGNKKGSQKIRQYFDEIFEKVREDLSLDNQWNLKEVVNYMNRHRENSYSMNIRNKATREYGYALFTNDNRIKVFEGKDDGSDDKYYSGDEFQQKYLIENLIDNETDKNVDLQEFRENIKKSKNKSRER